MRDHARKTNAHGCDPVSIPKNTFQYQADCAPQDDESKGFATLAAQFALTGHSLHRTAREDGPVSYFAQRWGLVRHLASLEDARRFLRQIGGAQ